MGGTKQFLSSALETPARVSVPAASFATRGGDRDRPPLAWRTVARRSPRLSGPIPDLAEPPAAFQFGSASGGPSAPVQMAGSGLQNREISSDLLHRLFPTQTRSSSRSHQLQLPTGRHPWTELVRLAALKRYPMATTAELDVITASWESSLAPNTQVQYAYRFKQFIVFCEHHQPPLVPLPATATTVDLFLVHMALKGTVAASSLAQLSSTINTLHVLFGYEPPVTQHESPPSRMLRTGLIRLSRPITE